MEQLERVCCEVNTDSPPSSHHHLSSLLFFFFTFYLQVLRSKKGQNPELKGLFDCWPAGKTSEDGRSSTQCLCRKIKNGPPAGTKSLPLAVHFPGCFRKKKRNDTPVAKGLTRWCVACSPGSEWNSLYS